MVGTGHRYGRKCPGVSVLSNLCDMNPAESPLSWHLTDCPRDAMQGVDVFIPTDRKVAYLSALMAVGFDTLDAGSFVSPKAIPQMADTGLVLDALPETDTRILAIVANLRGAEDALAHGRPDILGFPFSISETFQQRNTGGGIEEGWRRLDGIRNAVDRHGRSMVAYLSMGFGNPYGDDWSAAMVCDWCGRLHEDLGIQRIALSDTVGQASPERVKDVCTMVSKALPGLEVGAHLHGRPEHARELMEAAWHGGCRSFDGALGGHGGCPMAKDDLVGNLPTEVMMKAPSEWGGAEKEWDWSALERAQEIRREIFS